MPVVAVLARGVFWVSVLIVVGTAAAYLWDTGNFFFAVLSVALFPLTYLIFPWISGLHWVFLVGVACYALSTKLGMRPVN